MALQARQCAGAPQARRAPTAPRITAGRSRTSALRVAAGVVVSGGACVAEFGALRACARAARRGAPPLAMSPAPPLPFCPPARSAARDAPPAGARRHGARRGRDRRRGPARDRKAPRGAQQRFAHACVHAFLHAAVLFLAAAVSPLCSAPACCCSKRHLLTAHRPLPPPSQRGYNVRALTRSAQRATDLFGAHPNLEVSSCDNHSRPAALLPGGEQVTVCCCRGRLRQPWKLAAGAVRCRCPTQPTTDLHAANRPQLNSRRSATAATLPRWRGRPPASTPSAAAPARQRSPPSGD